MASRALEDFVETKRYELILSPFTTLSGSICELLDITHNMFIIEQLIQDRVFTDIDMILIKFENFTLSESDMDTLRRLFLTPYVHNILVMSVNTVSYTVFKKNVEEGLLNISNCIGNYISAMVITCDASILHTTSITPLGG